MGAVLAFFTGPLGKIAMYAIGALFAAGVIWAAWAHYVNLVEENATRQAKIEQQQKTILLQTEHIKKQEEVMQLQNESITALNTELEVSAAKFATIENYLASKESFVSDRPSSSVLKETVRKLKAMNEPVK